MLLHSTKQRESNTHTTTAGKNVLSKCDCTVYGNKIIDRHMSPSAISDQRGTSFALSVDQSAILGHLWCILLQFKDDNNINNRSMCLLATQFTTNDRACGWGLGLLSCRLSIYVPLNVDVTESVCFLEFS